MQLDLQHTQLVICYFLKSLFLIISRKIFINQIKAGVLQNENHLSEIKSIITLQNIG